MSKVLIIGCGGVASVAIHKCCQVPEVFAEICIASRTKAKCDKLAAELAPTTATKITTAQVDADKVEEVIALIKAYQPDLVMNIALPYQDLTIMDACLACGVNYMDTANYEPENTDDPEWRAIYEKRCKEAGFSAYFDYSWQWAYAKKFEEAGLTALLGSGFDPGVTQAYCAYAKKHEFDTIDTIDILDCNGGDHGYAFATNFNPEINLREVSAPGSYWENGHWVEIPAMSIKREYDFDKVGQKDMYLLHHEEIESLAKNIPEAKRIRFFMTFGQSYLDHMRCLEDVGMLSTTPINFNGQEIVPIQFLKTLLPDPASLGPRTVGKTNIGCIITGIFPGLMLWPINAILGDYNAGSLVVGLSGLQEGPGAWNATGLSVMMAIAAAAGWYFVRRFVVLREVDVHTCGLPTEVATSRMAPSGIYGGLVRRLAWFPGNTSVDNKS